MTGVGGCGCGQTQGSQGSCGCGRASVAGEVYDGAFTRPSFFDGQLLTSDDLQALTAYVRGKDRLHNRYLTGSGVVCGLDVVCSCSDRGTVVVRSGYALDCCGNDILVACDQLLDVNELVRSLPRDATCVDPCSPPTKAGKKNGDSGKGEEGKQQDDAGKGGDGGEPQNVAKTDVESKQPRRYELVVEYAETPSDLLAPYSTGEATSRGCEPSRIREGYRFRLRCASDKPHTPPVLVDALAHCAKVEAKLAELEVITMTARGLAKPVKPTAFPRPSDEDFKTAMQDVAETPTGANQKYLAMLCARFYVEGAYDDAKPGLQAVLDNYPRVRDAEKEDPVTSAELAELYELADSMLATRAKPTNVILKLADGTVSGGDVGRNIGSVVAEARDWALYWLEQRPGSDCRLSESLAGIRVPADGGQALLTAAETVTSAVRQILLDCICSAINPPCAPCEDEAVVLAHLTVDRCEVVEICNQARRYAITGNALRYWLPLEWLYCEIGKACCGDPNKVKALGKTRGLLQDLASKRTDCGWPQRWMPRSHKSISGSEEETNTLYARLAQLEEKVERLQPERQPESVQITAQAPRTTRTLPAKAATAKQTPTAKKAATARQTPTTKKATGQRSRNTAGGNTNA